MRIESTETLVEEANEKFEQKVKENDLLKENHQAAHHASKGNVVMFREVGLSLVCG